MTDHDDAPTNGTLQGLIDAIARIEASHKDTRRSIDDTRKSIGGLREDVRDARGEVSQVRGDIHQVRDEVFELSKRLHRIEARDTPVAAVPATVAVDVADRRVTERERDAPTERRYGLWAVALGSAGAIFAGLAQLIHGGPT